METKESEAQASPSPFLPMFETFRRELDEHHDRRERVIKASRDITAASKKIIFAIQRVRSLNESIPAAILKSTQQHHDATRKQFSTVIPELQSINAYRYYRQISPGIQEFMESLIFQHYLETQTLLTYDAASAELNELAVASGPGSDGGAPTDSTVQHRLLLTPEDYILGIFDTTGELMRFAITSMATTGLLPLDSERTVLSDLQTLRLLLCTLDARVDFDFHTGREVKGKMAVMLTSVDKVEKALYGLIVRGSERPKGWMPDLTEGNREVDVKG